MNIVRHPIIQCEKCEKIFCEICIDDHILNKNDCPCCRKEPFDKQKIGILCRNFMNSFKINCPFKCENTFGMIDFEKHKESCEKLKDIYRCSICDNQLEYQEDLKRLHTHQCEQLKKSCEFCQKQLLVFEYENHLKNCENFMKYCEECNLMVCNKYQEAHANLFCSHIKKLSFSIEKLENY